MNRTDTTAPRQPLGFTLLELLITLAIVGIVSTLALSSMAALMNDSESDNYTHNLTKNLNFSRLQAVSNGQTVTLCPLVNGICARDWSKEITIFIDADNNRTLGNNTVLRIIEAVPNQDQLHYTGTSLGISFYADGSIGDDDNGLFTYLQNQTCDLHARGVDVNNSGRARFIEQVNC